MSAFTYAWVSSHPTSLCRCRVPLPHGNYWWLIQIFSKQLRVFPQWLSASYSIKTLQKGFEVWISVSMNWRGTSVQLSEGKDSAITKRVPIETLALQGLSGKWGGGSGYVQDQEILSWPEDVNHQEGFGDGYNRLDFHLAFKLPEFQSQHPVFLVGSIRKVFLDIEGKLLHHTKLEDFLLWPDPFSWILGEQGRKVSSKHQKQLRNN